MLAKEHRKMEAGGTAPAQLLLPQEGGMSLEGRQSSVCLSVCLSAPERALSISNWRGVGTSGGRKDVILQAKHW